MKCFIAVAFSTLLAGAFVEGGTSITRPYLVGGKIPSLLSRHVTEEQLSSLVYMKTKDKNDHLCDGIIISPTRTMFVSSCILMEVIDCPEDSDDPRPYTEDKLEKLCVVVGSLTHSAHEYSIISMLSVDTDYYNTDKEKTEPFEILTLEGEIRNIPKIGWPMGVIDDGTYVVVAGWDESGEFKMYLTNETEGENFIELPPAADRFRGAFIFQEKKLVGLIDEICMNRGLVNKPVQPEGPSSYYIVCGKLMVYDIERNVKHEFC